MIELTVRKLPLINQRMEYENFRLLLKDRRFRDQFETQNDREFECGKFVWTGRDDGVTVLLQRIVLGLEARIPLAVALELGCQERMTAAILSKLNDPFRLGGRDTADCYYNCAPSLIDPKFALLNADSDLWRLISDFYRDIRNPIFHGSYITNFTAEKLDYVFSVFDRVYEWCDTWCDFVARLNAVGNGKLILKIRPN